MQNPTFKLKVQERGGIIFEGQVVSITSFNEVGEFDVLPEHANFISLIRKKVILRELDNDPKEIAFDNALLRVSGGNVEVYVGVEGVLQTDIAPSN